MARIGRGVKLLPEVIEKINKQADEENRSFNNTLETAIVNYYKDRDEKILETALVNYYKDKKIKGKNGKS